jgi:magnesium chelatase family protein
LVSKTFSGAVSGVSGHVVNVEVDLSPGLPSFDIVGLPDSGVRESKERVRTAIKNSGFDFPVRRITINLAPADIKKEGPSFDLPIAACILACTDILPLNRIEKIFFAGELSLDGCLRPVSGILPMVHGAFLNGIKACIVPFENAEEAALVSGINVYAVKNLAELAENFKNNKFTRVTAGLGTVTSKGGSDNADFSDVVGQEGVKRALTVAAAGAHNILMVGPPGSGKTMMAKRVPTILPPLSFNESIEVTKIYSVAGLVKEKDSLIRKRPFRSPHHTTSYSALTGGGRIPKPGEISLAHNGVLFLDEFPEFSRNVLEALRQPLEDRQITVARTGQTVTYPSSFMLVASMNPCPCGHLGNPEKCFCTEGEIYKYQSKISGPLMDRIDIVTEAAAVNYKELGTNESSETSAQILDKVQKAREIQTRRYVNEKITCNSELSARGIQKYCKLTGKAQELLKQAFENLNLSARAYHKILKLARTIADLNGDSPINEIHVAEAVGYRSFDAKGR